VTRTVEKRKCIQRSDVGTCKMRRRARHRHRWDNIIRDIQGTEWGGMDWTERVGGGAIVNKVMNMWLP
jgi:hypothetical protein